MRKLLINIAFAVGLLLPLGMPSVALAANCGASSNSPKGEVLGSVTSTSQSGTGCDTSGVNKLAGAVVSIISIVIGIAAVIVILTSGFKYITSGGDSNKVANAKGTLIWAVVGIIIAVLAQVIVHFVINTTKSSVPGA